MKFIPLLLCVVLTYSGCKSDTSKKEETNLNIEKNVFDKRLPNPCEILDLRILANIAGISKDNIQTKNSSSETNKFSTSCFYRWEVYEGVFDAILLQFMVNPVEDEAPDYLNMYIDSKKTNGERGIGDEKYIYKDFEGFGVDGAYSSELRKYYWLTENDILVTLAFNFDLDTKEELKNAQKIAEHITRKLKR